MDRACSPSHSISRRDHTAEYRGNAFGYAGNGSYTSSIVSESLPQLVLLLLDDHSTSKYSDYHHSTTSEPFVSSIPQYLLISLHSVAAYL